MNTELPEFDEHDPSCRGGNMSHGAGHSPANTFALPDGRTGLVAALIGDHAPGFSGSADSSPSEMMALILQNFRGAKFTEATVAELLDLLTEHSLLVTGRGRRVAKGNASESQWQSLCVKLMRINEYIKQHGGGPVVFYAAHHAWGVDYFDDINGHLNTSDFAKTQKVVTYDLVAGADGISRVQKVERELTKQAVNKAVQDAQHHFQLPPRPDQRDEDAKDSMKQARTKQLKR